MMKYFGHKGLVLGTVLCVLAWAGNAPAAGYEVRLPVEKTVRLAPPPEKSADAAAKSAKPAKPALDEKKAAPLAPKTEAPKAEAPKADAPKAVPPKAEAPKVEVPKAKAPPVAVAKPAPEPKPALAPKPKPILKVDPLALETPPASAPHEPIALPEDGHFVGDVQVEFKSDHIILRAASNGPVERVTHFGVKAPRKLALDLHGAWRKKGPFVLRFETGPVKNIVVGEHPDRLRLALEFREGAVEPDLQPKVEIGPKGVTVTIPLALHLRP